MPNTPSSSSGFDRLEQALNAWLDYVDSGSGDADSFLAAVDPDLRPLLEPMLTAVPEPPARPEHPERIGTFRILRVLGRGGMGVVYEAMDEALERRVALKVLGPHFAGSRASLERFRREAAAAARLEHPGIVEVYGIGETDGLHWIAMEFVDGGNLSERLRRSGSLGVLPGASRAAELAEIGAQIGEALDFAHRQNVVHRDVKPHNVLLDRDGRVRLVDFGLAKLLDRESLSATGEFAGSLAYASPEQVTGSRDLDARADVWSLGVVLYEGLHGSRPFEAETHEAVVRNILTREPAPPEGPRDLQTICLKALDKEPRHRFASAGAMAADLRRFLDHEPIQAMLPGTVSRLLRYVKRRRGMAAAVAAIVLLGALTLVVFLQGRQQAGVLAASARQSLEQLAEVIRQESGSIRRGAIERHRDRVERLVAESERLLALQPDDPALVHTVATAQDQAGRLYQLLKLVDAAVAAHTRAIDLFSRLLDRDPDDHGTRQALAACLHNRHVVHRSVGRDQAADADIAEAIRDWEKVLAEAGDVEVATTARRSLATALANRGRLNIGTPAVTADFDRAAELLEATLAAGGVDVTALTAALEVFKTRADHLAMLGRTGPARAGFDRVIRMIRGLGDIDHAPLQQVHVEALRQRARLRRGDKDTAGAGADLDDALKLSRELAAGNTADYVLSLVITQTDIVELLLDEPGEADRVAALLRDSDARLQSLQRTAPNVLQVQRELARVADRQAAYLVGRAEPDRVDAAFQRAIRMHAELPVRDSAPIDIANGAVLAYSYGRWLRDQDRREEARVQLERAHTATARALRANPARPQFVLNYVFQSQALLGVTHGPGRHDDLVAVAERMMQTLPGDARILRMAIRALDIAIVNRPGSGAEKSRYGLPLIRKAMAWIRAADASGVEWRVVEGLPSVEHYARSLQMLANHPGLAALIRKEDGR